MKTCSQIVSANFLSPYLSPCHSLLEFLFSYSHPSDFCMYKYCASLTSWSQGLVLNVAHDPELIRGTELYEPNSQETVWSTRMTVYPFAMRNLISSHNVRLSPNISGKEKIALGNQITWTDRGSMGKWGSAKKPWAGGAFWMCRGMLVDCYPFVHLESIICFWPVWEDALSYPS